MAKYEELLWETGLLPTIGKVEPANAETVINALVSIGIRIFDLPMKTQEFERMAAAVKRVHGAVLAVSGVESEEDSREAMEYGGEILLSYDFRTDIADWCLEKGLDYIPGCTTNSEIRRALEKGFHTVLYAPCFGAEACAELYEIWKEKGLRFVASNGIREENYLEYADKPYILAVRGDFICPPEVTAADDYEKVRAFAENIYLNNLGFELGHVGINTASEEEGHILTDELSNVFGVMAEHGHVGNWSMLRGIEIVNGRGPGIHGHIAVQCNNVARAIYYLENHGHKVKRETFRFRYPERLSFAYLEEEFGGFAIHLMLRWTAP